MPKYIYNYNAEFPLESGRSLPSIDIAYHTYGTLNVDKSNVVWVCHAFTGSADVQDWWAGLFGEGRLFNPAEYFIVCANVLGSCYGSTGPLSLNPATAQPYFQYFPELTVRDVVQAHKLLAEHLGVDSIHTLIGGSIGGQQALEWGIVEPYRIERLIVIAANAQHSPWGIAFNESQRLAIQADRTYYAETPNGGQKGLQAARAIAMLSYRNYHTYQETQSEESIDKCNNFKAASYQRYQGEKLTKRFNAFSYVTLSKIMDSHHVGRNRGGVKEALAQIKVATLVIGISTDILFPTAEQRFLAKYIPQAIYQELDSLYGHDGFLIEDETLTSMIREFILKIENQTLSAETIYHNQINNLKY